MLRERQTPSPTREEKLLGGENIVTTAGYDPNAEFDELVTVESLAAAATSPDGFRKEREALKMKEELYGPLYDQYGNEFKLPNYTLKELRDAIPKHCFERSASRGYSYIARDLACIVATFYIFHTYATPQYVPSYAARFALWGLYTFLQGLFGIGIWVMGHECNHQAFSESKLINDATGWVLHSALLVPYFAWKLSHHKHHALHNNLARDMQFNGKSREYYAEREGFNPWDLHELAEETPLWSAFTLAGQQLVGWLYYLAANDSGHNNHERHPEGRGVGKHNGFGGGVNHFDPESPLFENKDRSLIWMSNLGIVLTLGVLYWIGLTFGWTNLLIWYIIPYLWVNHWLVAITYLHHTDPSLPRYDPEVWNYQRGAAATMDRSLGWIGYHLFHEICETHVLHHTVPSIPFYHAQEASEAIQKVMGEHYHSDVASGPVGFMANMWKITRWCQWVEPVAEAKGLGKHVKFWRNHNGLGVPPMKIEPPKQTTRE